MRNRTSFAEAVDFVQETDMGNEDQINKTEATKKQEPIKVEAPKSAEVKNNQIKAPENIINTEKKGTGSQAGAGSAQPDKLMKGRELILKDDALLTQFAVDEIEKNYKPVGDGEKVRQGSIPVYHLKWDPELFHKHYSDRVEYDVDLNKLSFKDLKEKWEKTWKGNFKGEIPDREELIRYRDELFGRMKNADQVKTTMDKADFTGATFVLLHENNVYEEYDLIAKTFSYISLIEKKQELKLRIAREVPRPKNMEKSILPADQEAFGERCFNYPKQKTNNCFACVGSAIYNHLVGKEKGAVLLDQNKVRQYEPKYLTSKEVATLRQAPEDEAGWKLQVEEISRFAGVDQYGKNKANLGDFFSVSDVIFDKKVNGGCERKDIAVHKMTFELGNCTQVQRENQIEVLKSKLHMILGGGQMAVIGRHEHYLTITGLNGDTISYLDSRGDDDGIIDTNIEISADIHQFLTAFDKGYGTTELNWLSRIDDNSKQQLLTEFDDIKQDPFTKEIGRKSGYNLSADDVCHRAGIVIRKSNDRLLEEGYYDVSDKIQEFVALSRYAFGGESLKQEEPKEKKEEPKKEEPKKEEPKKEEPKKEEQKEKEEQVDDDDEEEMLITTSSDAKEVKRVEAEKKVLETFEKQVRDSFANFAKGLKKNNHDPSRMRIPNVDTIAAFDKQWKKENLSQSTIDSKIDNRNSELHKKADLAKKLGDKLRKNSDKYVKIAGKLPKDIKNLLSVTDLKDLSYFFSGDDSANAELVRLVSGRLPDTDVERSKLSDEVRSKMNVAALDIMTEQLLSMPIDDLRLDNDDQLLRNADRFTELSAKLRTYKRILDQEPEYLESLEKKYDKEKLDEIKKNLDILGAASDYFMTRCMILRHPVYLRHYDREIGIYFADKQSDQEKEFTKLLITNRTAAIRLGLVISDEGQKKAFSKLADKVRTDIKGTDEFVDFYTLQSECTEIDEETGGLKENWLSFREKINYKRREKGLRQAAYAKGGGIDYADCNKKTLFDFLNKCSEYRRGHEAVTKQILLNDEEFEGIGNAAPAEINVLFRMYRRIHANKPAVLSLKVLVNEGFLSSEELKNLMADRKLNNAGNIENLSKDNQERYFSSVNTLISRQYDLACRFLETYGSYQEMVSEPMLMSILTKSGKGEQFIERLIEAHKLSDLTDETVIIGGEVKKVIDVLEERNIVNAGFADKVRGMVKLLDAYKGIHTGGIDALVNLAVENTQEDKDRALEKLSEEKYDEFHRLTKYGKGYILTPKQQHDQSAVLRQVPREFKAFFEGYSKGRITSLNGQYVKKLLALDYELQGVENGRRTDEYIAFRNAFAQINAHLTEIAGRNAQDGKNLDPESLVTLRRLYYEAIKAAIYYVESKPFRNDNLDSDNAAHERLRIIREIRDLMKRDYKKLLSLDYDSSYSIDEAFAEDRYALAPFAGGDKDQLATYILADELGIRKDKVNLNDISGNEGDTIKQLADIKVMAYLSGKKQLPGGNKDNGKIKDIPTLENMLIISEKTANRILNMRSDHLFYKLGATMDANGKEAIWNRVLSLKKEILGAQKEGSGKNLQIIKMDEFDNLSLKELARAEKGAGLFAEHADDESLAGVLKDHHGSDLSYRFECQEHRIDLKAAKAGEQDALEVLFNSFRGLSDQNLRNLTPRRKEEFLKSVFSSSRLFNEKIGVLFNKVKNPQAEGQNRYDSTSYEQSRQNNFAAEHFDVFGSDIYAKYGVKRISDLFYIDGKRASEALFDKVTNFLNFITTYIGGGLSQEQKQALIDMTYKALIMSYARMSSKQVTLANFQIREDGSEVPVVTDINVVMHRENGEEEKESSKIVSARKARKERFHAIRKDMYNTKRKVYQKAAKKVRDQLKLPKNSSGFKNTADAFINEKEDERSDEFNAVKAAIFELYNIKQTRKSDKSEVTLMQLISEQSDDLELNSRTYPAILRLYNELSFYFSKHINTHYYNFSAGKRADAMLLRNSLDTIVEKLTGRKLEDGIGELDDVPSDKEKEFALDNLSNVSKSYFDYSYYIGKDMIATEPEKMLRRWEMLKNLERDIQIVSKYNKDAVKNDIMLRLLIREYKSVRLGVGLLRNTSGRQDVMEKLKNHRSKFISDKAKEITGRERSREGKEHSENGLSKEQLYEVRRIDKWLLQNFRNGGLLRVFNKNTDRSNIVGEIMKKSARERLYIYYIVQHSEARKKPSAFDAYQSQFETPKLENFANSMKSTKWKFYAYFTGSYVYWHKLSQALAICEGNSEALDKVDLFCKRAGLQEEAIQTIKKDDNAPAVNEDNADRVIDEYVNNLNPVIYDLIAMKQLEEKNKEKTISEADYNKQSEALRKLHDQHLEKIKEPPAAVMELLEGIKEKKVKSNAADKSLKEKGYDEAKELGGQMQHFKTVAGITDAVTSFNFVQSGFFRFMKGYGSASEKGISFIGSAIGAFFTIKDLIDNRKIIRNMDKVQSITGVAANILKLGQTGTAIASTFGGESVKNNTAVGYILGKSVNIGFAVADAGITAIKGISHRKNAVRRISASKLASKLSAEEKTKYLESGENTDSKYRDGMVKLNRLIGKKQKIETISSSMGSVTSVVSAYLLLATAASTGVIMLPTVLVSLAITFGSYKWSSGVSQIMKRQIDSIFFDVDNMIAVAKKEWIAERGQPMSSTQEKHLRGTILKRIASSYGYYAPSHLAASISIFFARFLLDGAKKPGDEGTMCIDMLKGLGLKVTRNPRTGEVISPTEKDIAKKICG